MQRLSRRNNLVCFSDAEIHVLHDTLVGGGPVGVWEESVLHSACNKIEYTDELMHFRNDVKGVDDE